MKVDLYPLLVRNANSKSIFYLNVGSKTNYLKKN
jgi:hypothetical protein